MHPRGVWGGDRRRRGRCRRLRRRTGARRRRACPRITRRIV